MHTAARKARAPAASGSAAWRRPPAPQADCWADAGPAARPQRVLLCDCARWTLGVLRMARSQMWVPLWWCWMRVARPCDCHSAFISQQANAIPNRPAGSRANLPRLLSCWLTVLSGCTEAGCLLGFERCIHATGGSALPSFDTCIQPTPW